MTTQGHPTSLRLDDDVIRDLDAYAKERGLTRTAAIMLLLRQGLGHPIDPVADRLSVLEDAVSSLADRLNNLEVSNAVSSTVSMQFRNGKRPGPKPKLSANHYLGDLCPRSHDWQGTGQSRWFKDRKGCVDCINEDTRDRRARKSSEAAGITT